MGGMSLVYFCESQDSEMVYLDWCSICVLNLCKQVQGFFEKLLPWQSSSSSHACSTFEAAIVFQSPKMKACHMARFLLWIMGKPMLLADSTIYLTKQDYQPFQ